MNLDDPSAFAAIDTQDMLSEIDGLPDQLRNAWQLGMTLPLPRWVGLKQVLVAGMGGSAIGADLLVAYTMPCSQVPILLSREYELPGWAQGPETLVVASSHSGNTEETLFAFEQAAANGCRVLAICTGGKLAAAAREAGIPLWQFDHKGQPRAAVGYSFGLLLAAFVRLGLLPNPEIELQDAIAAMEAQQKQLKGDVPVMANPAKRLAGQSMNRWVVVLGADFLAPVSRRWKGQVNELAKAWGQFEYLPEADHNTLAGVVNPDKLLPHTFVLFLQAPSNHPRNQLRVQLTKELMMLEGLGTDFVYAQGDTPLAQMWTALHYGDYFAYYLAMLYGVNPTPVDALQGLKNRLKDSI